MHFVPLDYWSNGSNENSLGLKNESVNIIKGDKSGHTFPISISVAPFHSLLFTIDLMAKQKQRWSIEEEEALSAGVERYGHGKWKHILSDPQFASTLVLRSNIDLKVFFLSPCFCNSLLVISFSFSWYTRNICTYKTSQLMFESFLSCKRCRFIIVPTCKIHFPWSFKRIVFGIEYKHKYLFNCFRFK